MKNSKKVVSKIGGVILGLSVIASLCPQTAQAQFIQRSFLNPSFEQDLVQNPPGNTFYNPPSPLNSLSPGFTSIINRLRNNGAVGCFIQVHPQSVPSWETTHTNVRSGGGNCADFISPGLTPLIELWNNNFNSVPAPPPVISGQANQVFAELNAEQSSQLYQNLCLFNNETVKFSIDHRARNSTGIDTAVFKVNNLTVGTSASAIANRYAAFSTSNNASLGTPSISASSPPPGNGNIVSLDPPQPQGNGWVRYSGSFRYTSTSGNFPIGFESIATGSGNNTIGNFIDNAQFAGLPVIEFSVSSGGAAEAETNPTSNPPKIRVVGVVPAGGIVVPISIGAASTAVLGTDFNTPTGTNNFTMTIPAGNYDGSNATSTFFIPFTIIQDGTTEGDESIIFEIGSSGNYFISSTTTCGSPPIGNSSYTVFDDEFLSGNVFDDVDNSANGTFTNIQTGSEVGTNAGGLLNAILVSSTGNVLATTPVNADGTYIFNDVPFNQNNVTIRLSTSTGTIGAAAPAASLPPGFVATSPLVTAPFNTGTNITGKDFGINQAIVFGYKSVNLTADPDNSSVISTGDTLTWRITYANTGNVDITNFQIIDQFPDFADGDLVLAPSNPITVSGIGTQNTLPTINSGYTGNGNDNLFAPGFVLKVGGAITVEIKTIVGGSATANQLLSNQAAATGTNLPVGDVKTDNIDTTNTSLPLGIPAPSATGNISQVQTGTIDPTTAQVGRSLLLPIFKLILAKRITAVNDLPIADYTADPDPDWATYIGANTDYLRGAISNVTAKPGDRIEYTIYFLASGNRAITNVTICDLVPANTTFVNGAYDSVGNSSNLGIAFNNEASPTLPITYFTSAFDSDLGQFYPAGSLPPATCRKLNAANPSVPSDDLTAADNTNGLVVVNVVSSSPTLTTLPHATGAGTPTNSYGFVRFQVQVK
ncbi:DUF11 domain-containing protein [Pseudanabaena mucicola]|uniref:DUF11 domain-containing protein n=1 Tax=Pseudanabaena mucicola FACHB-723 TaxID=2692860 RepID=A0ABR7ZYI4_9CYAN|nr:DUF11 domain-containing protein [Pseudanabaena mucicola]MBD2189071.1 DUF11 domain-containing protein [Pseudanabaena mucicola FACHB-723]